MTSPIYDQWIRKVSLIVVGNPIYSQSATTTQIAPGVESVEVVATVQGKEAVDLSQLRIQFHIEAADVETPNTAYIRVYNLADSTVKKLLSKNPDGSPEFSRVILNAGYQNGNFGTIFDGTIKQTVTGRENSIENFLEIRAADGDLAYIFGMVNTSLPASGTGYQQRIEAVSQALQPYGVNLGDISSVTGGILPRGKVLFGHAREYMRQIAKPNYSWSIQSGVLTIVPFTSYLPGEIVVLTAKTGLVGVPRATPNGIEMTCLLNPKIQVCGRVKLDNASIVTTQINAIPGDPTGFPQYNAINYIASPDNDGIYRVLVAEHHGDTWGQDFYTELTCLAVNASAPLGAQVLPNG